MNYLILVMQMKMGVRSRATSCSKKDDGYSDQDYANLNKLVQGAPSKKDLVYIRVTVMFSVSQVYRSLSIRIQTNANRGLQPCQCQCRCATRPIDITGKKTKDASLRLFYLFIYLFCNIENISYIISDKFYFIYLLLLLLLFYSDWD